MIARAALAFAACVACGHAAAASCFVSSVTLAFGNYNEFAAAPTDSAGNVGVTCSGLAGEAVAYSIALSAGGGGAFGSRRMRSPAGSVLGYNLYTTPARVIVWGDGNAGSAAVSDAYVLGGAAVTRNYPVYGRTFARQKAPVGIYSDSIVVTLNF